VILKWSSAWRFGYSIVKYEEHNSNKEGFWHLVFFIIKAVLLMLELIWGEVEVICVLLYVNYPEKKTELNEKMFQVAHKSEMQ